MISSDMDVEIYYRYVSQHTPLPVVTIGQVGKNAELPQATVLYHGSVELSINQSELVFILATVNKNR